VEYLFFSGADWNAPAARANILPNFPKTFPRWFAGSPPRRDASAVDV
jgi:hypothetical protein